MQNRNSKADSLHSASLVQNGLLAEAKFRPILFSTDMVTAILEGRKTMTRRIVKPNQEALEEVIPVPRYLELEEFWGQFRFTWDDGDNAIKECPYGKIGDVLWVREKFRRNDTPTGFPYHYYEDDSVYTNKDNEKWKPSIFMPKEACRIFLKVTDVKVERLQDIDSGDCIAEGYDIMMSRDIGSIPWFKKVWIKINGEDSWNNNPWVWVVEFGLTDCPPGFC